MVLSYISYIFYENKATMFSKIPAVLACAEIKTPQVSSSLPDGVSFCINYTHSIFGICSSFLNSPKR